MKIYGTTTSPFVRRVRVVAAEVGEPIDRVETATDEGQAALRAISPIRKVPVAMIDDRLIYDSRAIIDYLTLTRGYGGIEPPRDRWREQNLVNAVDGALEAIIQLFYLRRDGIAIDGTPFAQRQLDRTDAVFSWLAGQLAPDRRTFSSGFGLAELSVICTLDWMDFRKAYPTERAQGLAGLRAAWGERTSVVETRPHA
ncbi:MAG TPA: glutathione S-transferase family protein [Kofleriaceae bacterium]|nr:glutathione S-transferase family protein [Kofleriaceae bacterium]